MNIVVAFFTYTPGLDHPRVEYARRCLEALLVGLDNSEGELAVHIADDGSPIDHVAALVDLCRRHGMEPSVSVTDHRGYGGNYNLACQTTHQYDAVLCVEEDWLLTRPLDLAPLGRALGAAGEYDSSDWIGCIRLGYLGWTNELAGWLVQYAGQTFLRFAASSTEDHVWAGHPRLETVEYQRLAGPWPEGMKAGFTELEMSKRSASRHGVCWPLDAGVNASQDYASLFAHIGEVQA